MLLSDIKKEFYFFSSKTSEIVRQLGLAGFAIVWLIKPEKLPIHRLGTLLSCVLLVLTITLLLDILHYLYGSIAWGGILRKQEKLGKTLDDNIVVSKAVNWFTYLCYGAKVSTLIVSYVLLLVYIVSLQ